MEIKARFVVESVQSHQEGPVMLWAVKMRPVDHPSNSWNIAQPHGGFHLDGMPTALANQFVTGQHFDLVATAAE